MSAVQGPLGIGFYFGGISWRHKKKPCDQAWSTTTIAWRKKAEDISLKCLTNENNGKVGEKLVKLIVVIAYVVINYENKVTGLGFEHIIKRYVN